MADCAMSRPYLGRYLIAGAALVVAGGLIAAPLRPAGPHAVGLDVRLVTDSSLFNIPVNFVNDLLNIPYYLYEAPYTVTIPEDLQGISGVDGMIPNFVTGYDPGPGADLPAIEALYDNVIDTGRFPDAAEGVFHGAMNFLAAALFYTGSWWYSSSTNVWGWDTANPWNFTALIDVLLPIKPLSEPLGANLNSYLQAELPIAAPENRFVMQDVLEEFGPKYFFGLPLSTLHNGYTIPVDEALNPVGTGANPIGVGGDPYLEIWADKTVHVEPDFGLGRYFEHLMQDPADNPVHTVSPWAGLIAHQNLSDAMKVDFGNSAAGLDGFWLQLMPWLYSIPALVEGIINHLTGSDLTWLMPYDEGATPLFEVPTNADPTPVLDAVLSNVA